MSTKHTPGPWQIVHNSGELHIVADGRTVAEVFAIGSTLDVETPRANAALIAAAPELLEACNRAIAAIPGIASHGQYYADAIIADLQAAIAKAGGAQ